MRGRKKTLLKTCSGKYGCGKEKKVKDFDEGCCYCKACRIRRIKAARNAPEFDLDFYNRANRLWGCR